MAGRNVPASRVVPSAPAARSPWSARGSVPPAASAAPAAPRQHSRQHASACAAAAGPSGAAGRQQASSSGGGTATSTAGARAPVQQARAAVSVRAPAQPAADPNGRDEEGWTPLMHACADGSTQAAKQLLSRGADPNAQDPHGESPLMLATTFARQGGLEIAQALLDAGADPDLKDKWGSTALARAAIHNAAADAAGDTARLLLAAGADGRGPLEHALSCRSQEAVEMLLAAGVDPAPLLADLLAAEPECGEPAAEEVMLLLRAGAGMEGLPQGLKQRLVQLAIRERTAAEDGEEGQAAADGERTQAAAEGDASL